MTTQVRGRRDVGIGVRARGARGRGEQSLILGNEVGGGETTPVLLRGANNSSSNRGDHVTTRTYTFLIWPYKFRGWTRVLGERGKSHGDRDALKITFNLHGTSEPKGHIPPRAMRRHSMQMVEGTPPFATHKH